MHCVQIVCVRGGGILGVSLGWRTVGKAGAEEKSDEGIDGVCDGALRGAYNVQTLILLSSNFQLGHVVPDYKCWN